MGLSDDEREALVIYRLEKANKTFRQAFDSIPLEMTEN